MENHLTQETEEGFDANTESEQIDDNLPGETDVERIFSKLTALPVAKEFPDLLLRCRPVIELWYVTFESGPDDASSSRVWKGMRRNFPKELNESAFILDEMISYFDTYKGPPVSILDMCSGVGYLSMLLSHLLDPEKVSRIVPIDIKFRSFNDVREQPHSETGHLDITHLLSSIHPIPIKPRRANIKSARELRQIKTHCIEYAPGPVVILGIHLCKSLSVHTVRLFNTTDAKRLYLKPCCLPGKKELGKKQPPFWTFDHMEGSGFGLQDVYCGDCDSATALKKEARMLKQDKAKNQVFGGRTQNSFFDRWVQLLRDAADTENVTVEIRHCNVQAKHFQNQYIVARR